MATCHTARRLPCIYACRPAAESRKSIYANSERRRPSSTSRALASLAVHPCRLAMRLRRFPLSAGRRMLMTIEEVVLMAESLHRHLCKHCNISAGYPRACPEHSRRVPPLGTWDSMNPTCEEPSAPPQILADYFPTSSHNNPQKLSLQSSRHVLFAPFVSRKRPIEAETARNSLSWTILQVATLTGSPSPPTSRTPPCPDRARQPSPGRASALRPGSNTPWRRKRRVLPDRFRQRWSSSAPRLPGCRPSARCAQGCGSSP